MGPTTHGRRSVAHDMWRTARGGAQHEPQWLPPPARADARSRTDHAHHAEVPCGAEPSASLMLEPACNGHVEYGRRNEVPTCAHLQPRTNTMQRMIRVCSVRHAPSQESQNKHIRCDGGHLDAPAWQCFVPVRPGPPVLYLRSFVPVSRLFIPVVTMSGTLAEKPCRYKD